MFVRVGTAAVDKSHCAAVQCRFICIGRALAVGRMLYAITRKWMCSAMTSSAQSSCGVWTVSGR